MDLREYMFRKRLSLDEMAELLDCSISQIIRMRAGKTVSPKFARLTSVATDGEIGINDIVISQKKGA